MEDLKPIIAKNLVALRQNAKMTQFDLAEKLNYSDKAISKWERAESIPDVSVLKSIADLFGVTVDYLLQDGHTDIPKAVDDVSVVRHRNHMVITALSVLLAWFLATSCFVILDILGERMVLRWLPFLYAVPVSMVVWLIFNSIWFRGRRNLLLISLLVWSLLSAIHISFVVLAPAAQFENIWLLYILGIPGQAIILSWSRLMHRTRK